MNGRWFHVSVEHERKSSDDVPITGDRNKLKTTVY